MWGPSAACGESTGSLWGFTGSGGGAHWCLPGAAGGLLVPTGSNWELAAAYWEPRGGAVRSHWELAAAYWELLVPPAPVLVWTGSAGWAPAGGSPTRPQSSPRDGAEPWVGTCPEPVLGGGGGRRVLHPESPLGPSNPGWVKTPPSFEPRAVGSTLGVCAGAAAVPLSLQGLLGPEVVPPFRFQPPPGLFHPRKGPFQGNGCLPWTPQGQRWVPQGPNAPPAWLLVYHRCLFGRCLVEVTGLVTLGGCVCSAGAWWSSWKLARKVLSCSRGPQVSMMLSTSTSGHLKSSQEPSRGISGGS
ncbi:uncharacterized protein LOC141733273 [Larus michahellis]|uniref:uncharacterized protein LOC141733273 n=1 Tax=Larus michahellis TaxID=119627 RepID=UPI003D9B3151